MRSKIITFLSFVAIIFLYVGLLYFGKTGEKFKIIEISAIKIQKPIKFCIERIDGYHYSLFFTKNCCTKVAISIINNTLYIVEEENRKICRCFCNRKITIFAKDIKEFCFTDWQNKTICTEEFLPKGWCMK